MTKSSRNLASAETKPSDEDANLFQLQATLAARVRGIRLRRQMTGVQLAMAAGISKGMLSQIESGKALPSVPVLAALAKALAVTVGDLFGGPAAAFEPMFTRAGEGRAIEYVDSEAIASKLVGAIDLPGLKIRAVCYQQSRLDRPQLPIEFDGFWIDHGLAGEMVIRVGAREFALRAGDTLTYRAEVPHAIVSATSTARVFSILGQITSWQERMDTDDAQVPRR